MLDIDRLVDGVVDRIADVDSGIALEYAAFSAAGAVAATLFGAVAGKGASEHVPGLQCLCVLFGIAAAAARHHTEFALFAINPWDVPLGIWFAGYAAKLISIHVMDAGIAWGAARFNNGRLRYRINTSDGKPTDHPLIWIDYLYMSLNSFVETAFLFHLTYFTWHTEGLAWQPSEMNLLNVLPALWVCLFVNDMLYAPMHLAMHHRWIYAFIHKHHHRSLLPSRYYTDAGNDHPLEQVGGLLCLMAALNTTLCTTGLHIAVLGVFFPIYLVMQILNHSPFDCRFNLLGISYESGLHEMHHRIPSCNMAQYCMTFDKFIGTYRPYQES